MKVSDIMTPNPKCIESDELITKARAIMRDSGFRALPVCKNGVLEGIITRGDVLKVTSTRTNLTVKGLMRAPIYVYSDEDIFPVARKMVESGVRQLIVTDKSNKITGIVSSMDVLFGFLKEEYRSKHKTVEEIMKDAIFCNENDEVSKIWNMMSASGLSGFPVVKGKRVVVGFITIGDLIRGGFMISRESGKQKSTKIGKVMKALVTTVSPEDSIIKVAEIMARNKMMRVPVVDKDKKLLGIVDIEDIISSYL